MALLVFQNVCFLGSKCKMCWGKQCVKWINTSIYMCIYGSTKTFNSCPIPAPSKQKKRLAVKDFLKTKIKLKIWLPVCPAKREGKLWMCDEQLAFIFKHILLLPRFFFWKMEGNLLKNYNTQNITLNRCY